MPELGLSELRDYTDHALRQPDFDTIRQRTRSVRQRRAVTSGAGTVVAVALLTAVGFVASDRFPDKGPVAAPALSGDPSSDETPRATVVTAGSDLYVLTRACRDCPPRLYGSAEMDSWQERSVPAPDSRVRNSVTSIGLASIVGLGPDTLLWTGPRVLTLSDLQAPDRERPGDPITADRLPPVQPWITVDGGWVWRLPTIEPTPVAALPPATRPVDCVQITRDAGCPIYAVDPATGRFAALATQPTGITVEPNWSSLVNVPLGGQLWIPGSDPVTGKPAVATSADGGRSWQTHVFTSGLTAETDDGGHTPTMYLPQVAAGMDGTAYALTHRHDGRMDAHRSTDSGVTWQQVDTVPEAPDAGHLTTDGAHVVKTGTEFRASRDGGRYERANLPGYTDSVRRLTQVTARQADRRFIVSTGTTTLLSTDGWRWQTIPLP